MSAWKAGEVQWFDESSGEGMIIDKEDGTSYYVHYSAIRSKQKFKKLEKGKEVKFKLYETSFLKQVDEVKEV
jgi:cold shock CspA family protein